jgi:NADP-dependent 3-hydroxy acid dehydrogenase YdfG
MPKTIMITGASSGFGKALAYRFAENGNQLILTGRRSENLESLQKELQTLYKIEVHISVFDVRLKQEVFDAINSLPEDFRKIDILINNAGLALGRDLFQEAEMDDWETMMQTNVMGLLYVTRAVLPLMKIAQQRHIINIGSIAGKEVYEKGNVYCASKAAVDSLSKAMRIDLLSEGIKVTAIHPGAAETEFSKVRFKGDEEKAAAIYKGYRPLSAEDVAEVVYFTTTLPEHVCINDLVLTCTAQANSFYTHKKNG